jgi:3-oxoacyl-[acyl-carrier-protein] synthase III
MANSTFHHAKIGAISAVVPQNEIRLEDELEYFGGDIKKARRVTKMVGIDRRRVAEPGVLPSDLCRQAAENLFAGCALDVSTVDALVFVSQSPDYVLPATACILQDKLGLPKTCAALDVNQGCAGFVYGLWLASSLAESGPVPVCYSLWETALRACMIRITASSPRCSAIAARPRWWSIRRRKRRPGSCWARTAAGRKP